MVMRMGGLATGMDIESMVDKLMDAERIPLVKMEQDRTNLAWERDAFRDINRSLLELDRLMFDMKRSRTYQSKSVTSSQENAVTATGNANSSDGAYQINVKQLARSAINVSANELAEDDDQMIVAGTAIEFSTYKNDGSSEDHSIEIDEDTSLKDVLKKITDEDNHVRAFYDDSLKKVIMETTRNGEYNENGSEIVFEENSFFSTVLNMDITAEKGGENAQFEYNNSGVMMESKDNSYVLNGVTLQFKDVTEGNATLIVMNDTESTFDSIMTFVDTYNQTIEKLNESQQEEKFRDFPPLTDEQKKDMSEDEIKKWEEKAQSGILRGESAISNGLTTLRQNWYSNVATDGEFTSLTQIGISTSKDYMDGGKLIVNEADLREAIIENPQDVQKLFSNSSNDKSRGLINRLEDTVQETMGRIENRAGKSFHTLENYTLGKRMKGLDEQITEFEARMVRVENRYWNQFTQMEKAIQRMNNQSEQLLSQFGQGM